MPFTEEQEKLILSFVESQTAAQKAAADKEAANKAAATDKTKSGDAAKSIAQQVKEEIEASKAKSIVDQAKDAVKSEKDKEVSLNQIQESIKFNLSANDFVEKNKTLLPEEAPKILAAIATKTFKDDNEKANTTRKNLLDSFLEKKDNLSAMTSSMQTRAEYYKSLAESDKEKRSAEFWDLVEVGTALKQAAKKAEVLNKINGVNSGDDSTNIIESKMMAAAKERFQPTKI